MKLKQDTQTFLERDEIEEFDYLRLIENKTIAIVAPSKSLEGKFLGKEIDSHEIVVRLNNGYRIPKIHRADFGTKVSIVYHYLGLPTPTRPDYNLAEMKRNGVNAIVVPPRPEQTNFEVFLRKIEFTTIPYLRINQEHQSIMKQKVYGLPFCGVWAIFHLLQYPIQSLKVYGMNFFSTGHVRGYDFRSEEEQIAFAQNSQFDPRGLAKQHHIPSQKLFIRNMVAGDSRLSFDEIGQEALKLNNHELQTI